MPPKKQPKGSDGARCSYEGCKRPQGSQRFHLIDEGSKAGGQDWTHLAGTVLCAPCYLQFLKRGTLERTMNKHEPLARSARRCTYEGCKRPQESRRFYQIDGGSEAGGQDWTHLAGSVLCRTCYVQYSKRGRLERSVHRHETLPPSARRCSYEGCKSPLESSHFYQIDGGGEAGGQDWTELAGRVLCDMCYQQYRTKGTLKRTLERGDTVSTAASRSSSRKRKSSQPQKDILQPHQAGSSSKRRAVFKEEDEEEVMEEEGKKEENEKGKGKGKGKERGQPQEQPAHRSRRGREGGRTEAQGGASRRKRAPSTVLSTVVENGHAAEDFGALQALCRVCSVIQKEEEDSQ